MAFLLVVVELAVFVAALPIAIFVMPRLNRLLRDPLSDALSAEWQLFYAFRSWDNFRRWYLWSLRLTALFGVPIALFGVWVVAFLGLIERFVRP